MIGESHRGHRGRAVPFDRHIADELQRHHARQRHSQQAATQPDTGLVPDDVADPALPVPPGRVVDIEDHADVREFDLVTPDGTGDRSHVVSHAPALVA